ncbi:hypothetical protein [Alicyclobacillus ferrooxydans]|uniref:Uncharacterized protein n=1 Tax=Alicyclobacillus ferrooxydans TaxID=471514 RepID=A0A0P9EQ54_9BACL|nr:hypothetical protein [Alicyclobacillus ferrooxydans]KPV45673.1 hypothetical protein AN477_01840 [Alicyclobacillus ferrooxydans]
MEQCIVEAEKIEDSPQNEWLSSQCDGILFLFMRESVTGIEWLVLTAIPGRHIKLPQSIMTRVLGDTVTAGADDHRTAHLNCHADRLGSLFSIRLLYCISYT